jgi:hypothetical protein
LPEYKRQDWWPTPAPRRRDGGATILLLVDGDPVAQLTILQDKKRLLAIMKDGSFHKAPARSAAH